MVTHGNDVKIFSCNSHPGLAADIAKLLGVTVSQPEYTITLTCDKDGNLS